MSGFDAHRDSICESLRGYNTKLDKFKCMKKKELKRVVLTNGAIQLHDELVDIMKGLKRFLKKYAESSQRKPPVSSLETLLPDLVIAAVLWCEEDTLINSIKSVITSLKEMVRRLRENSNLGEGQFNAFYQRFVELKKKIEESRPATPNSELQKNHDFLSQQIDARSSQVFTMGPLFVPISFLIFVYTVNSTDRYYLGGVPLMFASLSCYLVWFIMYLRTGRLNSLSYPLIHSLELMLGLSTHSSLFQIREKHWIVRIRQHVFYTALFVLVTLWDLYLMRLTEIETWKPSTNDPWTPAFLAFLSLSLTFGLSLLWEPSTATKDLVLISILFDIWVSILMIRFMPPFLAAPIIELLMSVLVIWPMLSFLFYAIARIKRDP